MEIKIATLADIDKLVDLFIKFHTELSSYNTSHTKRRDQSEIYDILLDKLRDENNLVLFLESDEKVLGFIFGSIHIHDTIIYEPKTYGFIHNIWVDKTFRDRGYATRLMHQMLEFFKTNDCDFVQLDVLNSNEHAKEVYAHWKFDSYMTIFRKRIE